MRFACLYVPDFPLAAEIRGVPELRGESMVVADGPGPRAVVRAVAPAAARHGVTVGLSVAQAMAIDAALVVRPASPDLQRAAQAALCDAAGSFSPRIEEAGNGVVYLDLSGLGALYETEGQLATALAQRTVQLGIDAQVGVAGSKIAASLAARNGGGVAVIPSGEEWSFLAPVSVALLQPSPPLLATFQRWGIRNIGDLAALPVSAVGTRLGPEGVLLMRRARGEDDAPLVPRELSVHFEEGIDLDYGLDNLEAFTFVVRGLLARLTARVAMRGLVCGDLRLSLRLATRGRDERTVTVAAPSNDVKSLLALVRMHFEAHPSVAAIEAIRVVAIPERLRAAQLDLFRPNGPAPERLAVTLARLTALCGADRVGTPMVAESHRPDAYGIAPFSLPGAGDRIAAGGYRQTGVGRREAAGRGQPRSSVSRDPDPALRPQIPLALRAFRPPQAVEVFCARDRPEFVRGDHLAGRVVHTAGPWRLYGDWWHDGRFTRDYYDAQLSDGCVYRLYCDLETQGWFVEGVYD